LTNNFIIATQDILEFLAVCLQTTFIERFGNREVTDMAQTCLANEGLTTAYSVYKSYVLPQPRDNSSLLK
jgi:hypothetical protein